MKENKGELPRNIFLFILDAVRKDHLGLYGYKRKTSVNINLLSQQSDVYNWAFSPSSYTISSVPSMLASKYPFQLSNLFTGTKYNSNDLVLLERVKKLGYKTAIFTANIVTSSKWTNLNQFVDFMWDDFTDAEANRPEFLIAKSENVIAAIETYLTINKKERNFIIIHLMEAHGPYLPEVQSIFQNDKLFRQDERILDKVVFDDFRGVTRNSLIKKIIPKCQLLNVVKDSDGNIEDFERRTNFYIAKYDMGIYLQDKHLGDFFEFLKKENIFDSASIAITSDHGELMGENNIFFSHGIFTHPALINVPLVIKKSFQKKSHFVTDNFTTTDLIPLLLNNKVKSEKESFLQGDFVYSFTAKSFTIISSDFLFLIHNGEYHHAETIRECLLPTNNFSLKKFIDNYANFHQDFHVEIFRKSTNKFKSVSNSDMLTIENSLEIFSNYLKNIFLILHRKYGSKIEQIQRIEDLEAYITNSKLEHEKILEHQEEDLIIQSSQYKNLKKENLSLKQTLNKIYSSKFFKVWQLYNKFKKKLKINKN